MKPDESSPGARDARIETRQAERQAIESLIDDIGAQSFPASDPPAWGVVSSRLEEASRASPVPKRAGGAP